MRYIEPEAAAAVAEQAATDHVSLAVVAGDRTRLRLAELPAASRALTLVQDSETFLSPAGVPYVCLPSLTLEMADTPFLAVPVHSRAVAEYLQAANAVVTKRALGRPAIESAQIGLEGLARERGVVKEVSVRRWLDTDTPDGIPVLWVDLGPFPGTHHNDREGLVYAIWGWRDETGDSVAPRLISGDADDDPAGERGYHTHRWYRPDTFLSLPFDESYYDELLDVADSDLPSLVEALRPHVNAQDETALLKMVAWLLGAWHPSGGPYKLLYLAGPTGVAKTMTEERLGLLVDPRREMVKSVFPKDTAEVKRRAEQQGVMVFDNVTTAPLWFQNTLSQLASGFFEQQSGGKSLKYCRPLLVNGLTYVFTQPDLRARTLVAELRPFDGRVPDEVVNGRWERERPRLQALLLRVVATGLTRYADVLPTVKTEDRFASAEAWLIACEPATGLPEGTFQRLLHDSQEAVCSAQAATGSPEGQALVTLLAEAPDHTWTGTGKQLVAALRALAAEQHLAPPTDNPAVLMRVLRKQAGDLATAHRLTWTKRHSGETMHTFTLAA